MLLEHWGIDLGGVGCAVSEGIRRNGVEMAFGVSWHWKRAEGQAIRISKQH